MILARVRRLAPPALLVAAVAAVIHFTESPSADAQDAKKEAAKKQAKPAPKIDPDQLLKPKPRPARPALSPSKLPLTFFKGEKIAFVGNSTAERMNLFGYFEALLHTRFPAQELVVRNFGRPADEVGQRQRASDYTKLDDPVAAFSADTYLCFFGWNESFAGAAGVDKYKDAYEKFLTDYEAKYSRDDSGAKPRFVLVSPAAFEPTGDPLLPDGKLQNENLKLYAEATKAIAEKRGIAFLDLFTPSLAQFAKEPGMQFTINGFHANEAGDKELATIIDAGLFGPNSKSPLGTSEFEKLRAAIIDKSWVHSQDHRMINGWYVYGGRRTFDTETFPREYVKIRNMTAVRDKYVSDIAQGKPVADKPDDSATGELTTPQTRFGQVKYSESPDGPRILDPDDLIKTCTVPKGFEIKLFADEKMFPELAKPVQMTFDNKGRLWVSTMPSYPQWKPGDPKPNDKLLILEDTNGDGKADKCTTFYDKLHCPVGFELWGGGVLVLDQPHILFLKDTDGDDKADQSTVVMDGWATEDTHHSVNAWEFSNGGQLHMLEGVSMSTAVETPWGPFRNFGSSGAYVVDPRTWRVRHFNTPGYGNPWCYVYNQWGQGFCGDGTGANQHWDTLLSGAQYQGRSGANPVFATDGLRPVVGSEFLVSRQFPDDVQGDFIYACVINMNGMPRWKFVDDGGGYKGIRVRNIPEDKDKKLGADLIRSTEKHFRPVDPQIGPDGALWFGDWANPLIGHMQYSQRDPNRDHTKGRIYRLVYKDKPLLKPVTQFGKSVAEVLEQFREYEWRTRYRARRELQSRPATEVLPAVATWVAKLDPADKEFDRLRCEALWIQEAHHAVDPELVKVVAAAKTPDARAAVTHIIAEERDRLPEALTWLKAAALDENPRVRTEAVRGLSFFPTPDAAAAVLASIKKGNDYAVDYTGKAALGATLAGWSSAHVKGELAKGDATAKKILDGVQALDKKGMQAVPYLQILLGKDEQSGEAKNKAMRALADMKGGNAESGKVVFKRNCLACHKLGSEGQDYGPAMEKVGTRLTRFKVVESIIDPNAEIDKKYFSTKIEDQDGKTVSGLVIEDTKDFVTIFDGKDKKRFKVADIASRTALKQSSMPEGQAGTMSPAEFLDVIEFLSSLK